MALSEVRRAVVIDLLAFGDNSSGNIAVRVPHRRGSVSRRFPDMAEEGLIERKEGPGDVFTLTEEGRREARRLLLEGYNPYVVDEE